MNSNLSDIDLSKGLGLYDPATQDRDSCGVGFVVDVKGRKSRKIIDMGLEVLAKIEHRGAVGADPLTGDGAGIMMQVPDAFFRRVTSDIGIQLPEAGRYGVGFVYFTHDKSVRSMVKKLIEKVTMDEGQNFLGWREVPINPEATGQTARKTLPHMMQCFIGASDDMKDDEQFERKLYLIRRVVDRRVRSEFKLSRAEYYVPSFSCRTIVYKGMLLPGQMTSFYQDLNAQDMESALAMIHQRFSTNTFPTWDLAHPFRAIAHNGEINTLRGNVNWMAARQMVMESPVFGKDLRRMIPIILEGQSDSASFDLVVELLMMTGRSLPHAIMMMIPEAWSKNPQMDPDRRGFYEYHATFMEPWDGPAAMAFSDGNLVGAILDRNGLRPARYIVTKDDLVIMASEAGTISVPPENIAYSGRLKPGKMFLIDMKQGRIVDDSEIKDQIVHRKPYRHWVEENMIRLTDLPDPIFVHQPDHDTIVERQRIFGYTYEDVHLTLRPMAVNAQEPVGSMGTDTPLAVLAEFPQPLFRYFKQNFAQVTNPAIDPIREELVMELTAYVGPEGNLLDEKPEHARRLELSNPVLNNSELEKIRNIKGDFKTVTINILFDPDARHGMRNRLNQVCEEAVEAIRSGHNLILLSDRGVSLNQAPIPSLLAVSAVHHTLIREGMRTKTGIIIESGEPREVSHFALLIGYGANAINPYLAFETLADQYKEGNFPELKDYKEAKKNYIKAIGKGLFKVFSKMGISTLQSYCGAQIFEAVGLDSELVNLYFTGTPTRIEGLSLEMLEDEVLRRHKEAYNKLRFPSVLNAGGFHFYRKEGEHHELTPTAIYLLQTATVNNDYKTFKQFTSLVSDRSERVLNLRSLFDFDQSLPPVPVDEVESELSIVRRFQTGAMSLGSISPEAHETIAIAMNRLKAKSNSGEGGEDPARYIVEKGKDSRRSAIKQVASARFGVTANYLVNADDIQIKISQGAKPGEGGQLPGHKVDHYIARLRFSTPGVTLISPPPHHDIYSIEDLGQLIFDLKNVNPNARISVKLVSEVGVGTVAAGVTKAHADHILIAGHDGGTGASPVSSIHYAGTPWELGLSETHQALVANGLRDRVTLAVDGKIISGREVVIGALLGAEEFGFATSALIVLGCIMMRKCHLNTCPVGVATQDPELRKRFHGNPDNLINFLMFIAREVREIMAQLGYRSFNEMVGQIHRLHPSQTDLKSPAGWKIRGLDFSRLLAMPEAGIPTGLFKTTEQNHGLEKQLDHELIRKAGAALENRSKVKIEMPINSQNRSAGAMLSGEICRRFGEEGLPEDTIDVSFTGTAGQSFGAFAAKGLTLRLTGLGNDYVGKGLSGGRIIIKAPDTVTYNPAENIIIGNTCFYGGTSGEAYISGIAGERFCVRNSGVKAVVEGTGDHGCEYMTGGRVVVIGETGRNFAAGMSGGIAYVWDAAGNFTENVNTEMVDLEDLDSPADTEEVLQMITRHRDLTGSERADFILKNWETEKKRFIKIMPGDYKLALQRIEEEKSLEVEDDSPVVAHT